MRRCPTRYFQPISRCPQAAFIAAARVRYFAKCLIMSIFDMNAYWNNDKITIMPRPCYFSDQSAYSSQVFESLSAPALWITFLGLLVMGEDVRTCGRSTRTDVRRVALGLRRIRLGPRPHALRPAPRAVPYPAAGANMPRAGIRQSAAAGFRVPPYDGLHARARHRACRGGPGRVRAGGSEK